jgi:hypothetical protein
MSFKDSVGKRRRKRLPISPDVADVEVFRPKRRDWQRIQGAFGVRLSSTHRSEIIDLVDNYLFVHDLERSAPFANDAIAWLRKLKAKLNEALGLMRHMPDTVAHLLEAEDYARVNLVALFRKYREGANWSWGEIVQVIAQLERGCGNVIRDFETLEDGFKEGSAWELLITRLTELADHNDFPSRVAKGGSPSPFVKFVRELQETLPQKFRKHLHSDTALAQAILRSRRIQNTNAVTKAK